MAPIANLNRPFPVHPLRLVKRFRDRALEVSGAIENFLPMKGLAHPILVLCDRVNYDDTEIARKFRENVDPSSGFRLSSTVDNCPYIACCRRKRDLVVAGTHAQNQTRATNRSPKEVVRQTQRPICAGPALHRNVGHRIQQRVRTSPTR